MTRFVFASFAIGAALTATACSSNSRQATRAEYDDVAQHVGSTTSKSNSGGELASMNDAIKLSTGVMPLGLSVDVKGHINGSRLGVTLDYTLACSDAAGAKQTECNDKTDRADVSVSWNGQLVLPSLTASVDRKGAWSISGLQSKQIHLNGDGTFTFDSDVKSILHPGEATYHLAYAGEYKDVVLDTEQGPVSGTIHYAISADHTATSGSSKADGSFDIDAVLTFTGAGKATLVLDGTEHYDVDLATGIVVHI